MDAKLALEEFRQVIEPLISKYFDRVAADTHAISPDSVKAIERLQEFTLRRAKRIRAALMCYTYGMVGGKDKKEILLTSIFAEVLQAYLLAHDDVMDQDSMRRGKPTMHKIYEQDHIAEYSVGNPLHFGESMAINVGDIGCHLSMKILADSKFPDSRKIRAISKLHDQIVTVGHGQMLDVLGSVKEEVDEEYVMKVHKFKTAKYTYETPMCVGAILAGAKEDEIKALSDFAIPAGIAFQIQDDILGMFGNEEKLGKANTSDLKEGKHTLLIVKALEKGNRKQVQKVTAALGNHNLTDKQADEVRQIIRETGSLEYSEQLAEKYAAKAKAVLAKMPKWKGEGRDFLESVVDYTIKRDY